MTAAEREEEVPESTASGRDWAYAARMGADAGAPEAPAPVVRTFLFTDLEDHSSLWEADPDGTAETIEAHDRLMGEVVAARGGTVVKSIGDGVMAVFPRCSDAVAAARVIQERVTAVRWPVGPVRVRIGVHVGPAYERDGDWFGPTVNLAARLCDAAHGGQVVASEPVVGPARAERWVDLGEHRFRGIGRPERVHQLLVGDRVDFPALRKVEGGADRLPRPTTSFVGRRAELAEVTGALRDGRLVTLTSIGGGGKTRLAIEAARALAPELADGADFVDLAGVADEAGIAPALASALRLDGDDRDPRPALARVVDHCRGRRLLLVLDNCEHLLDGAGSVVEEIVRSCPAVVVLRRVGNHCTSRASGWCRCRRCRSTPRSTLFVDRAALAGVDVAGDPAVEEICERLDGIPLAIELAAARTGHLTPSEIAGRLGDRFRLLTGGNRRVQRQQTLQATLDWTHALLDDDQRAMLRRLAVFGGGSDWSASSSSGGPPGPGPTCWTCWRHWSTTAWWSTTRSRVATACWRRCGSTPSCAWWSPARPTSGGPGTATCWSRSWRPVRWRWWCCWTTRRRSASPRSTVISVRHCAGRSTGTSGRLRPRSRTVCRASPTPPGRASSPGTWSR